MGRYSEREILIWLKSINISNLSVKRLNDYFSDLRELLELNPDRLLKTPGIKTEQLQRIVNNRNEDKIEHILQGLEKNQIKTTTYFDNDYPLRLRYIYDSPLVIYHQGEFVEEDKLSMAIVGARKSTPYGKWACEMFTKELVALGVTIVSGLALGIDSIAHKTTLKYGGRTIAVLGNGLDIRYPKNNEKLYGEISQNGVLISEFPLGTQPLAFNFPLRNRIISGLSLGVVVIEAKEKSGSLITAHHALEQGKDVFAVPGNINSIYSGGTNKLIKDGAFPLSDIDDILEEIYEIKQKSLKKKNDRIDYSQLSDTEIKITEVLKDGPVHSDIIIHKTGLDTSTVVSVLTILEIKGIIKELTSRTYAIS